jgi:hypothetical protein
LLQLFRSFQVINVPTISFFNDFDDILTLETTLFGFVVVTPDIIGEPLGIIYGKHEVLNNALKQQQQGDQSPDRDEHEATFNSPLSGDQPTAVVKLVQNADDGGTKQQSSQIDNNSQPLDSIPRSTLEQIQKRYQWNDEQMQRVLETFRQETKQQQQLPPIEGAWTPHQKLNFIVYVIMISVMIYVLNQEYGNFFGVLMAQFFPREAKLLGITFQDSPNPQR